MINDFKGITEQFVTSPSEIIDLIYQSKSNRHVSVTSKELNKR